MKKKILMVVVAITMVVSVANASVWTVDFQGNDNHLGLFGQTNPIDFVVSGLTINVFEVQALNRRGRDGGSDFTVGPMSQGLLSEAGGDDGVTLTINSAGDTLIGWSGTGGGAFTGDWLNLLAPGGDSYFGIGQTSPVSWTVTGLKANTEYEVKMFHGYNEDARGIDFTANGEALSVLGVTGRIGSMFVTTDALGDIIGTAAYTGNEGNWAGMQIFEIPEPATISLLGIGVLSLIRRRRK